MAKNGNKKVKYSSSEATESYSSSGDLFKYPTKGKVDLKGKNATKGKKVET